jgi:glycosyltransferase involved in cell wall biosynthesis
MTSDRDMALAKRPPRAVLSTVGKFHILALAKELNRHGALAAFFTGYPLWKLDTSELGANQVHSHPALATAALGLGRAVGRLPSVHPLSVLHRGLSEAAKREFERHVARSLPPCDVFHGMSQYSLKPGLAARERHGAGFVLDVGSSHVLALKSVLNEAYCTLGIRRAFFPDATVEKELEEYRQADIITVPSRFAARTFEAQGIAREKLRVNVLGVDLSHFFPSPAEASETFTVTFIGALSVRKGLHVLLEAFARARIPKSELVLIGSAQPETEALLARADLANVRLLGRMPQRDLREHLARSPVFVLPSLEDGFGMVILEAMASGCAVIASTSTGGPDVIEDGENGLLVAPGDAEALSEAFVRLYRDRALLAHMREEASRRAARSASWQRYGDGVVEMYRSMTRVTA